MMEFYSGIATLGATMMYSFTKTNIFVKIIYLAIFLTSINYWRDPKHGFRRNLDMVCVCTGFLYQIFLIYNYRYYAQPYYICMCIGLKIYNLHFVACGLPRARETIPAWRPHRTLA